jgi:cathepsin L
MSPLSCTLVLMLASVAMASSWSADWANFKYQHTKIYSGEEDVTRMNIWHKNVKMVEKHNSENHSYTMAINKFSDWTEEEFQAYLGYQPRGEKTNVKHFQNSATPDAVDFRAEGKVTPPKDQGQCGSCWAFSATGGIEGVWAKNMGELVSVSEQQLVDCAQGGCNGGHMINGWTSVASNGGIMSEESYPYTAKDGNCHFDDGEVVSHVTGYEEVSPHESSMEAALVEIGYPISIGVHAGSSFQHYSSGVYSDNSCKNGQLNHAILVVGYDKTGSEPYWIVKNSWGGAWGDHGYINMKMGINICGIKSDPCYPTM